MRKNRVVGFREMVQEMADVAWYTHAINFNDLIDIMHNTSYTFGKPYSKMSRAAIYAAVEKVWGKALPEKPDPILRRNPIPSPNKGRKPKVRRVA